MTSAPRIVVGIDDSRGARDALDWALDEASRQQGHVTMLHAFRLEVAWIDRADIIRWAKMEREAAEYALQQMLKDLSIPQGVDVDHRVAEGNPVDVLVEASADADLLVVGSRGRGGLAGLLIGSVSERCVERAHCPVVVVPPPR